MPNAPRTPLDQLSHWQQIAFLAALGERSLPNYRLFSELCDSGDPAVLRQNLNLLWDCAAGLQSAKNFEKQLDLLEDNTPDPTRFDSYGVRPGLDCCVLLNAALSCAMKSNLDDCLSGSTLSLATVAEFLEFSGEIDANHPDANTLLREHPLYLQELGFQQALCQKLLTRSTPNKPLIQELRKLAANEGVSQIGISAEAAGAR
ncbi:YjaG family protein [Aestuariirhabdus sp. LZHN29]|uniref:YjaG family protein n=1 Tax=Aestuariirhabdus sp. LZHN29 TaxID=3417462 RepID=UPI003CF299BA